MINQQSHVKYIIRFLVFVTQFAIVRYSYLVCTRRAGQPWPTYAAPTRAFWRGFVGVVYLIDL